MTAPDDAPQSVTPSELTIAEAARLLGVSPSTVRRMIKQGTLKAEKVPSGYTTRISLPERRPVRDGGNDAHVQAPAPESEVVASSSAALTEMAEAHWRVVLDAERPARIARRARTQFERFALSRGGLGRSIPIAVLALAGAYILFRGIVLPSTPTVPRTASIEEPTSSVPTPTPQLISAAGGTSPGFAAAPAPTPPDPPTSKPGAPVPAPISPGPATLARVLIDEDFADERSGWTAGAGSTAWLARGAYHLHARHPGRFVAVGLPRLEPLRDVVVAATFRKVGGPPGGGYGLIVRDQGPGPRDGLEQGGRYYVFEVGDRGEVGAWRREGDRWAELLPWTPSTAVRPGGATNQLTVQAVDRRLVFLVNGLQVVSLEDPDPRAGTAGIFVGGDFNEVILRRLIVQQPDARGEQAGPGPGPDGQ